MAVDAAGRIAVAGSSKTDNVDDTLVSLRAPDGSPAAFGTGGIVKIDLAPALLLVDVATDIAFRPGGGLVTIIKRETDPAADKTDYIASLRGFTEDGSLAGDFGAGGETALSVGEPDTNATALLERSGMLWVTGSTSIGVQTDGFIARVDGNGNGLQFRRFDIHGNLDAGETVATNPNALALLPGTPETLVAAGSVSGSSGAIVRRGGVQRHRRRRLRRCPTATSSSAPPASPTRSSAPPPTGPARSPSPASRSTRRWTRASSRRC